MNLEFEEELVRGGREARERFHDARGYGRVEGGDIVLAPVEAAHLLARGDVDRVDGHTVADLFASGRVSLADLAVYADLRERGFYLTPGRLLDGTADFVVYPRGSGPWDDRIAYRIDVIGERDAFRPEAGVVAVVDEDGEVSYLDLDRRDPSGTVDRIDATLEGRLVEDRVLVADPPAGVYDHSFFGQPLPGDIDGIGLSLPEATHLGATGRLALTTGDSERADPGATLRSVGRDLEGDRFERRLAAYRALRAAGIAPKTGYKFGADFRTYAAIESVDDLGHSEWLVRVRPATQSVTPRDLALDVRMAHGVRKTMVHALVEPDDPAPETVEWLAIERLTP